MNTNIVLLTVILTNWANVPTGDFKREDGTNYSKQWIQSIETNVVREEVIPVITYRTNRTVLVSSRATFQFTNSVKAWNPVPFPELPGVQQKQ